MLNLITPVLPISSGIFLGSVIGVTAGKITGFSNEKTGLAKSVQESIMKSNATAKMQLRKEELDISKKRIQTGTVSVRKEVLTENKTIVVPVTRENLIIEKKTCGAKNHEESEKETIRIPLKTERVEIVKHPETLEDVSIYTRKLQKNERINATVKKEQVHLEAKGSPQIKEIRKYRHTPK